MTRLIDADEIVYEETLRCVGRTGNSSTYYHDYHVWDGDIDKIPTVDAVPVELIKEMIARLRRRRMNLDDDSVDEAWDLKMQIEALDDLLSEWAERKEE